MTSLSWKRLESTQELGNYHFGNKKIQEEKKVQIHFETKYSYHIQQRKPKEQRTRRGSHKDIISSRHVYRQEKWVVTLYRQADILKSAKTIANCRLNHVKEPKPNPARRSSLWPDKAQTGRKQAPGRWLLVTFQDDRLTSKAGVIQWTITARATWQRSSRYRGRTRTGKSWRDRIQRNRLLSSQHNKGTKRASRIKTSKDGSDSWKKTQQTRNG